MPPDPVSGEGFGYTDEETVTEREVFGDMSTGEVPPAEEPPQEPAAPPATPEEPAPEAPEEPAPQAPGTEPAPATPVTQPTAEGGFSFAGRPFADQAAAERSYTEIRELQRQTAVANAQLAATKEQYEQLFQEALPYLQERARQGGQPQIQQPAQPAPSPEPNIEEDPAGWARWVSEQNERRFTELRQVIEAGRAGPQPQQVVQQEMAAYAQRQRYEQDLGVAVAGFREAHPDVLPNSEAEQQAATVYQLFREHLPLSPEGLSRAHFIATNPELFQFLRSNPGLAATQQGMTLAMQTVGLPAPITQGQPPAATRQTTSPQQARAAAHVETGPSGTTPTPRPKDEIDELFAIDAEKGKSVFFGKV